MLLLFVCLDGLFLRYTIARGILASSKRLSVPSLILTMTLSSDYFANTFQWSS